MQSVPAIMQSSVRRMRVLVARDEASLAEPAMRQSETIVSPTKAHILQELGLAYERLQRLEDGTVDTTSNRGVEVLNNYFTRIESASAQFSIELRDRSYREEFCLNYRLLFQEDPSQFRVDVLESCLLGSPDVPANGESHAMGRTTVAQGEKLLDAWKSLNGHVEHWRCPKFGLRVPDVLEALRIFDREYAVFEQMFIIELIAIEERARRPLLLAVAEHQALQRSELPGVPQKKKLEAMTSLVECVGRLNSVANSRGHGRDDLTVAVWHRAILVLQRCQEEEVRFGTQEAHAAKLLAEGVVDSMAAVREYLSEAGRMPDSVDPQLRNNAGLVDRLVDWEESWQTFQEHAMSDGLLNAICAFERHLCEVRLKSSAFASMCEDTDAELFVVLPRLLLLCYLREPKVYGRTVQTLLPVRFQGLSSSPCLELSNLQALHSESLQASQRGASAPTADAADAAVWTLVQCAVRGRGSSREAVADLADLAPGLRDEAKSAVSALMHALEGLSVDLQRHNPTEWNRWAAVVLQCLEGSPLVAKRPTLGPEFNDAPVGASQPRPSYGGC